MTLDSMPALIIALIFVLPGVVYQISRTRAPGSVAARAGQHQPHGQLIDLAWRRRRACAQ